MCSKYLDTKCITKHEDFHHIVISKPNLYTALVGMHDMQSSFLNKRNSVPNRSCASITTLIVLAKGRN